MFDFKGNAVLITGAAQGFGRVSALAFAQRGANLALCDINDEGGEKTRELVEAAGTKALYVHTDISSEAAVESFVATTVDRFGRLDIAVNSGRREHQHQYARDHRLRHSG